MSDAVDVITLIVVVAGIMVMVRPGSQGPALVSAFGNAFGGALNAATGSVWSTPQGTSGGQSNLRGL